MPVTIEQATATITLLDDLYPIIELEHVRGTWIWLIHKTGTSDQIGSMHVKLCPIKSKAIVTVNDYGGFIAFPNKKILVDIEYARSSPEAAEEELNKVKDLFQELSDLIGDDDTQYTPDGDIHGGEDDPRPVAGSPP